MSVFDVQSVSLDMPLTLSPVKQLMQDAIWIAHTLRVIRIKIKLGSLLKVQKA